MPTCTFRLSIHIHKRSQLNVLSKSSDVIHKPCHLFFMSSIRELSSGEDVLLPAMLPHVRAESHLDCSRERGVALLLDLWSSSWVCLYIFYKHVYIYSGVYVCGIYSPHAYEDQREPLGVSLCHSTLSVFKAGILNELGPYHQLDWLATKH